MSIFENGNNLPYTNFHEANLDWLIKTVKEVEEVVAKLQLAGVLPVGGSEGQALVKKSDSDFDTEWSKIETLPEGAENGQILSYTTEGKDRPIWVEKPNSLPLSDVGKDTGGYILRADSAEESTAKWSINGFKAHDIGDNSGQMKIMTAGNTYYTAGSVVVSPGNIAQSIENTPEQEYRVLWYCNSSDNTFTIRVPSDAGYVLKTKNYPDTYTAGSLYEFSIVIKDLMVLIVVTEWEAQNVLQIY